MSAHGEFISRVRAAVRAYDSTLNDFIVDMCVAFFAHETGFGEMGPYAKFGHYNLGNITRAPSDTRPVDLEPGGDYRLGPDGEHIPVDQRWAVFTSDEDGVRGWFAFLSTPHYAQALAQLHAGDSTFVRTLGALGYYGETVDHYLHGVPGHSWDTGFLGALKEVQAQTDSPVLVSSSSGESGSAGVVIALALGGIAVVGTILFLLWR